MFNLASHLVPSPFIIRHGPKLLKGLLNYCTSLTFCSFFLLIKVLFWASLEILRSPSNSICITYYPQAQAGIYKSKFGLVHIGSMLVCFGDCSHVGCGNSGPAFPSPEKLEIQFIRLKDPDF